MSVNVGLQVADYSLPKTAKPVVPSVKVVSALLMLVFNLTGLLELSALVHPLACRLGFEFKSRSGRH